MPDTALNILMVSAEMVPFAKTGGLADVVGALPKALKELGHDIRVVIPRYGRIRRDKFGLTDLIPSFEVELDDKPTPVGLLQTNVMSRNGVVPVYMVENATYFDREGIYMYDDDADRFILFCRAALEACRKLGWQPDIIHCHDWQTAVIPNWLKTIYKDDPFFANTASVYTIHNLAYQGVFGNRVLEIAGIDEFGYIAQADLPHLKEVVDFMGRGIYYADIINTVSETYAREILEPEYGEGLDLLLRDRRNRLYGVLNGIDTELNNPQTDPQIAANYDTINHAGKQACKADLQRVAGLPERPQTPLIGINSRLAEQKGFNLIDSVLEPLLRNNDVQVIVLGTGEQRYHERLQEFQGHFPQQLRAYLTFNYTLAQKIYAGADLFLMPSRFEPCGLGQMIALRYGTIPVVRRTGGLADTVRDFDPTTNEGNGFSFAAFEPLALYGAIVRGLENYRYRSNWQQLMIRAMAADNSWANSARRYEDLYHRALATLTER